MDTENHKVEHGMDWYFNPDPAEEAEEEARHAAYRSKANALLNKVRAGEMTEDECAVALLQLEKDLGYTSDYTPKQKERIVRNFMMHELHQDELDRYRKETGINHRLISRQSLHDRTAPPC
jgi:hypothetical protein